MSLNKNQLLELSEKVSDLLIADGITAAQAKDLSMTDISKYSEYVTLLFDDPDGLYDVFHEEETLSYFKSLLAFDIAFKTKRQHGT